MSGVYLDHNATSPIRPEVIEAASAAMRVAGNVSAQHSHGRAASSVVEQGREAVALAMGVCAQDLIFTSGGTESDNTAIHSAVLGGSKRVLVSSVDHPATALAAEASGAVVEFIPADASGRCDMGWLKTWLETWDAADGRPFVSIVAANSETGVIQDCETATELTQAAGGLILIDAVQALGKIPMTFLPDYMSVSAHKLGGPQGIGALYVSPDAPFASYSIGGGQERRRRAGTHNVAGIAGFGAAVKVAEAQGIGHTKALRDYIEAGLRDMEPDLQIFGETSERLPNTSFFAVPDASNMTLLMALDLSGVSVSTGMACSSGKTGENRTLKAMGVANEAPKGPIRVSFGYNSTQDDAERFLSAWAKIRRRERVSLKGAAE
ncbi:MAG: cysteine desulfurase family protein [Maricaulaceae bacterium]